MKDVYLAGCVRTPVGSFCGALEAVSAVDLGITSVKATLERSGVGADQVEELLYGNVVGASLGPNVARQVTIGAGFDPAVGAATVNKLCGSGMMTVIMAAQAIQTGDAGVIMAGGTENMSRAPYLLEKARTGYRLGNSQVYDSLLRDALIDPYDDCHMGECAENLAEKYSFSREAQDDYAIESYNRARAAASNGEAADEIVPVEIKTRKGSVTVDQDEEPARFNEAKFRTLRGAFRKGGTVTAGNASSINDGAGSTLVLSKEKVELLGIKPDARILGYATHSLEPAWFTLGPVGALQKLLKKLDLTVDQVDFFEVNEAFAVVPMAAMRDIGIAHKKLNVLGGAVAIGHPIGASGVRVLATLINVLRKRGGKVGIASLCIGGGEGIAMAIELC
ncbi:MAG: acetyl-CoA C-acetyltransferase [Verrucomicrobia bacterium]|nr:MAG: acetyl-CoA C-acetyltransferase [Verrucomicrobiota bacterium]